MGTRTLGVLTASEVGFGAMVLSPGVYGSVDEKQARRALLHAIDLGATFIDTSDSYGSESHNESFIGATLPRRSDVVISTKFGLRPPAAADRHTFDIAYATLAVNAEPRYVRDYATASLRRLRTDYLDLYSPHFPDPAVPIEETVGAIAELVDDGLVRHIGLSNVSAAQLERAARVHPICAVQCEWSLWTDIDPMLLDVADRLGVGIVAWGPLGSGLLTGGLDALEATDLRRLFPRLSAANLDVNIERFAPYRNIAAQVGCTPAQLALAWLLSVHPSVVPIPGSRTLAHITENVRAADVEIPDSALAEIGHARRCFRPAGSTILEQSPTGGR